MTVLRFMLVLATVAIFAVTIAAAKRAGINWPAAFMSDLLALNWRSQFNADLVIHLALVGCWVAWREGWGAKGAVFGVFCVVWGGMFTFPYVLIESIRADGDPERIFLGANVQFRGETP